MRFWNFDFYTRFNLYRWNVKIFFPFPPFFIFFCLLKYSFPYCSVWNNILNMFWLYPEYIGAKNWPFGFWRLQIRIWNWTFFLHSILFWWNVEIFCPLSYFAFKNIYSIWWLWTILIRLFFILSDYRLYLRARNLHFIFNIYE